MTQDNDTPSKARQRRIAGGLTMLFGAGIAALSVVRHETLLRSQDFDTDGYNVLRLGITTLLVTGGLIYVSGRNSRFMSGPK